MELPPYMRHFSLALHGGMRGRNVACIAMEKARRDLNASNAVFLPLEVHFHPNRLKTWPQWPFQAYTKLYFVGSSEDETRQ